MVPDTRQGITPHVRTLAPPCTNPPATRTMRQKGNEKHKRGCLPLAAYAPMWSGAKGWQHRRDGSGKPGAPTAGVIHADHPSQSCSLCGTQTHLLAPGRVFYVSALLRFLLRAAPLPQRTRDSCRSALLHPSKLLCLWPKHPQTHHTPLWPTPRPNPMACLYGLIPPGHLLC